MQAGMQCFAFYHCSHYVLLATIIMYDVQRKCNEDIEKVTFEAENLFKIPDENGVPSGDIREK